MISGSVACYWRTCLLGHPGLVTAILDISELKNLGFVCFFFQTGPKGVIQDYRRYKQLETEQRKEKEKEMRSLAQKFSVSCQSSVSHSCYFNMHFGFVNFNGQFTHLYWLNF